MKKVENAIDAAIVTNCLWLWYTQQRQIQGGGFFGTSETKKGNTYTLDYREKHQRQSRYVSDEKEM